MKLSFVKKPMTRSFTLGSTSEDLKKNILITHKIFFDVYFLTKTHISLLIQSGEASFRYNAHSDYSRANNLTFVEKREWSYFTGTQSVNQYFKLTKKQNLEVLGKHILSLTEKVLHDLGITAIVDQDILQVRVWIPEKLLSQVV